MTSRSIPLVSAGVGHASPALHGRRAAYVCPVQADFALRAATVCQSAEFLAPLEDLRFPPAAAAGNPPPHLRQHHPLRDSYSHQPHFLQTE